MYAIDKEDSQVKEQFFKTLKFMDEEMRATLENRHIGSTYESIGSIRSIQTIRTLLEQTKRLFGSSPPKTVSREILN